MCKRIFDSCPFIRLQFAQCLQTGGKGQTRVIIAVLLPVAFKNTEDIKAASCPSPVFCQDTVIF